MKPRIIVTRPGDAGRRLRASLQQAGHEAVWWPAFEIGAAPDAAHARRVLAELDGFDLALLVSPAAVRATAALLAQPWPATTAIGAVGAATAAAVGEWLRPAASVPLIAPASSEETGSEAFMAEWQQRGRSARRVLILRAQHGREWLAQRFAALGSRVDTLAVYSRNACELDASARRWLAASIDGGARVATVFSSSEAIAALDHSVRGEPRAAAWLRAGTAVATHARIAGQLLASGYSHVVTRSADDATLITQLESL